MLLSLVNQQAVWKTVLWMCHSKEKSVFPDLEDFILLSSGVADYSEVLQTCYDIPVTDKDVTINNLIILYHISPEMAI